MQNFIGQLTLESNALRLNFLFFPSAGRLCLCVYFGGSCWSFLDWFTIFYMSVATDSAVENV